jgi:hypothetical protein
VYCDHSSEDGSNGANRRRLLMRYSLGHSVHKQSLNGIVKRLWAVTYKWVYLIHYFSQTQCDPIFIRLSEFNWTEPD